MATFRRRLDEAHVLIADGATGTNLQQAGLRPGEHPEEWVYTHPGRILRLAEEFVEAGADIILTCTFGASWPRLAGSAYASQVGALNQQAVALAKQAASGKQVMVGGSMGPLGQLLKPYGPLSTPEATAAYAEQADALAAAGVDLIVIETQFSLEEAAAAVQATLSVTDLPIVLTFSFDRGTRTMMGVRPTDVADTFRDRGLGMLGANCGTTLENAEAILEEYCRAIPGYPLWAKPNAGLPRLESGSAVYDVTPERMAQFAEIAVSRGARVVGGCCGSTPEHVRAIARAVRHGAANTREA